MENFSTCIFSAHISCGEISPHDRFSPPFSCGEIFHLTDLSPHFSCGEISPCDRVSPHLSSGEFSHLTCHGENFSTWPIFSPQTASVASVTNIRYGVEVQRLVEGCMAYGTASEWVARRWHIGKKRAKSDIRTMHHVTLVSLCIHISHTIYVHYLHKTYKYKRYQPMCVTQVNS